MDTSRILIVDDEIGIRELLSDILADEGYHVCSAEDATSARALIERNAFDLILLDIWMPDMDGVTLLKELCGRRLIHCPVLMMSGHATIETAVEATRYGALDCLEKPISLKKLLRSVEKALRAPAPEVQPAPELAAAEEPAAVGPAIVAQTRDGLPSFTVVDAGVVIDFNQELREARDAFERAYFGLLLRAENGQVSRVAKRAGLERTHLYRKLKNLGIDVARREESADPDPKERPT